MPTIKSAFKRDRISKERQEGNKAAKSIITTTRRKFLEAVGRNDKPAAQSAFSAFSSALDRGAKRGFLKANNASRRKGRAAAMIARMA